MTDRVKGLYVALTKEIRIDDVQCVVEAIKMIKCVADVKENISNPDDYFNRKRVKEEIREAILQVYNDL